MTFDEFQNTRKWHDNLKPLLKEMGVIYEEEADEPSIAGYTYCNDTLYIEDATTFPETAPGYGHGHWCVTLGNRQEQDDDLDKIEHLLYKEALALGYE
jgi:hypothetical protein